MGIARLHVRIVAHDAVAGIGENAIGRIEMFGRQRRKGLGGIGRQPHILDRTSLTARNDAIADGIGIAHQLNASFVMLGGRHSRSTSRRQGEPKPKPGARRSAHKKGASSLALHSPDCFWKAASIPRSRAAMRDRCGDSETDRQGAPRWLGVAAFRLGRHRRRAVEILDPPVEKKLSCVFAGRKTSRRRSTWGEKC